MQESSPAFFDGLSTEELEEALASLERRRFPAGAIVVAEGESPHELYIIQSGSADVLVVDRHGAQLLLSRLRPGATLGEMSLLTGEPAGATVRAAADLELLVLSEAGFNRVAARFPQIYRNIGGILSERLARTNRRSLREPEGRITVLRDWGAPPLLGYALACSVAWHARVPTVLLVVADDLPEELAGRSAPDSPEGARIQLAAAGSPLESVAATVEELSRRYDHVLVRVRGDSPPLGLAGPVREVHIAGPHDRTPADGSEPPCHTIRAWADPGAQTRPDRAGVLHVPQLDGKEESALRDGLLPAAGAAGRALGWAARDLASLKVGLALGAGSSKGYAHFGVLRVLERAGLSVDYLAGTSIGAAVAGAYAVGYGPDEALRIFDRLAGSVFRLAWPTTALLSSGRVRDGVRAFAGNARLENLPVPLALTAADLMTGTEVVFRSGLLWPAVMASMAIPGIYPPQRMGAYRLVDGGVLNPVPSNVVAEMGADIVIAVRLGGDDASARSTQVEAAEGTSGGATMLNVIMRSIEMMQSKITTDTAETATLLISPSFQNLARVPLRRFGEGRRYVEAGDAAAEAALPRIAAALPWLQG